MYSQHIFIENLNHNFFIKISLLLKCMKWEIPYSIIVEQAVLATTQVGFALICLITINDKGEGHLM